MSDITRKNRKRRVQLFKRLIIGAVLTLLLLPTAVSIYLGVLVHSLRGQLGALQSSTAQTAERAGIAGAEGAAGTGGADSTAGADSAPDTGGSGKTADLGADAFVKADADGAADTGQGNRTSGIRKVYLTFDDGPSMYTDEILDILKTYDVKATFFVTGSGKEPYEEQLRRIVEEGHTLGMHSYSHDYQEIYSSRQAFIRDVNLLQDYLHEVTGKYPEAYRFPGGSSNQVSRADMQELKAYLQEIGVTWYDWNISGGDASGHPGKNQIVRNCTEGLADYRVAVILLHDAADKKTTVQALPEIIETILKMEDTVIVPITADTVPIQHGSAVYDDTKEWRK